MNTPPHLDAGRIYRLAPLDEVVHELRKTFASGPSEALGNGDLVLMPAVAGRSAGVQGLSVLLSRDGGAAVATLDDAALTARRTPAVSALATDVLARPDVRRLAVFGTGVQAREHVRAMRWVRPSLEVIEIVGREPASTERFVAMLRGEGHPAVASSASEASSADLICTCTSSPAPVLINGKVLPGAHINVVGSRCEICAELMGRARVVDNLVALSRGSLKRSTPAEITAFVSVGVAVEDLVVATLAARNAGLIA